MNEHCAWFPAISVNVYVTVVVPTGKSVPGWWDWVTVGAIPELSVAVGSVQVNVPELLPGGTIKFRGSGQPLNVGGTVSSPRAIDEMC